MIAKKVLIVLFNGYSEANRVYSYLLARTFVTREFGAGMTTLKHSNILLAALQVKFRRRFKPH